jgi:ribosomal-protein-alanine N-acetyltransferase
MNLTLRAFRLRDLPALLGLERRCFARHGYGPATFLYYYWRARAGFQVAEAGGQSGFVGYFITNAVRDRGGPAGELVSIAVAPECRRQGMGRLLLRAAADHLRRVEPRVSVMRLQVEAGDDGALAFYRQAGFREEQRLPHYYGPRDHALQLAADLDDLERRLQDAGSAAMQSAACLPEGEE